MAEPRTASILCLIARCSPQDQIRPADSGEMSSCVFESEGRSSLLTPRTPAPCGDHVGTFYIMICRTSRHVAGIVTLSGTASPFGAVRTSITTRSPSARVQEQRAFQDMVEGPRTSSVRAAQGRCPVSSRLLQQSTMLSSCSGRFYSRQHAREVRSGQSSPGPIYGRISDFGRLPPLPEDHFLVRTSPLRELGFDDDPQPRSA